MNGSDGSLNENFEQELVELGVIPSQIEHANDVFELYVVHTLWPGERRFSLSDIADKLGVELGQIEAIRVASGFALPESTAPIGTERDLEFYQRIFKVAEVLGWDEALTLVRVISSAQIKIADAATSTFLVNVDPTLPAEVEDIQPGSLDAVRELVDDLSGISDTLLLKHLVAARRDRSRDDERPYETQQLAIGFADMAGSTELASRLTFEEIAALLSEFETTTITTVNRFGGRVVKLIGDEVLFATTDPAVAARIAFDLMSAVKRSSSLPPVRIGVAAGEILVRDGDVFGPPVNRAARITKTAAPGSILVTPVVKTAATDDFVFEAVGSFDLPGFSGLTELWRIQRPLVDVSTAPEIGAIE